MMNDPIVIVTGASSGIGEGFARALAERGDRVLLVARRQERLESICRDCGPRTHFWTGDLREAAVPGQLLEYVARQGWVVEGLINNAGLGAQSSLAVMSGSDIENMLQLNVAALVRLTHAVIPGMKERRSGFILNLSSMAGFQPVPYFAVYAATKAFVTSFSEAIHEEVKSDGVFVGCLCPGPVDTEFQKVAGINPRFYARSQSVGTVVKVGMQQIQKRRAVAWTDLGQRCVTWGQRFVARSHVRWLAGRLLQWAGAK
jgi:uncharacterized protein